jgi:hypothetical protein
MAMRMKVICFMIAALTAAIATPKPSTVPDLSGIWILDLAKSDLDPAGKARPAIMEIAHEGRHLSVLELVRGADGTSLIQQHYTLDGHKNAVASPAGIEFISARCTGKAIQIRSIQRNDQPVTTLEEWLLSQDGTELRIRRRAGRSLQRLVFKRSTELPE